MIVIIKLRFMQDPQKASEVAGTSLFTGAIVHTGKWLQDSLKLTSADLERIFNVYDLEICP